MLVAGIIMSCAVFHYIDESVDEEEQVNNEISDSFIAKANQFLKDIHVRSKDEWKDIKQELNTAASPTFLDTENAGKT